MSELTGTTAVRSQRGTMLVDISLEWPVRPS